MNDHKDAEMVAMIMMRVASDLRFLQEQPNITKEAKITLWKCEQLFETIHNNHTIKQQEK